MFIKPSKVTMIISPHRYNDYYTIWGDLTWHGSFRHFDGFKYTLFKKYKEIKNIFDWIYQQPKDLELRNYTLYMLENLLDITFLPL